MKRSVLIVDDDVKLTVLLKTYFEREGFVVHTARDGLSALAQVRECEPDILVLDIMLPGLDGWEVCRRVRKNNDVPIIMLTARDEESDRLVGLEIGADDYVTKPFSPKEVVARAKAILRRVQKETPPAKVIELDGLFIEPDAHRAVKDGAEIPLTPTEFKILALLSLHPGKVFSRLQLVEQVQGYSFEGYERSIDAHVKNLRRKIGDNPKEPKYIKTVYGIGYAFAGQA